MTAAVDTQSPDSTETTNTDRPSPATMAAQRKSRPARPNLSEARMARDAEYLLNSRFAKLLPPDVVERLKSSDSKKQLLGVQAAQCVQIVELKKELDEKFADEAISDAVRPVLSGVERMWLATPVEKLATFKPGSKVVDDALKALKATAYKVREHLNQANSAKGEQREADRQAVVAKLEEIGFPVPEQLAADVSELKGADAHRCNMVMAASQLEVQRHVLYESLPYGTFAQLSQNDQALLGDSLDRLFSYESVSNLGALSSEIKFTRKQLERISGQLKRQAGFGNSGKSKPQPIRAPRDTTSNQRESRKVKVNNNGWEGQKDDTKSTD